MELKNCEKCGRIFGSENDQRLCNKCLLVNIEDDFKLVRNYLYDHPGADVSEVSEATGVSKQVILKLLKEERIEVVDSENLLLKCEDCGKSIKSGRKCEACKNEIAKQLFRTANDMRRQSESEREQTNRKAMSYHSRKN